MRRVQSQAAVIHADEPSGIDVALQVVSPEGRISLRAAFRVWFGCTGAQHFPSKASDAVVSAALVVAEAGFFERDRTVERSISVGLY
jgi:hypothetical protein